MEKVEARPYQRTMRDNLAEELGIDSLTFNLYCLAGTFRLSLTLLLKDCCPLPTLIPTLSSIAFGYSAGSTTL